VESGLLFGLLLMAQATATAPETRVSEAQVVELARHATARYCQNRETIDGKYYRTRCDFRAQHTTDGWVVSGHPIYEDGQGRQEIAEGGDVILYYSPSGMLLGHDGASF